MVHIYTARHLEALKGLHGRPAAHAARGFFDSGAAGSQVGGIRPCRGLVRGTLCSTAGKLVLQRLPAKGILHLLLAPPKHCPG